MIKYILHGGATSLQSEDNRLYYREMVKGLHSPKVLLVYFARELDHYDDSAKQDTDNFQWANQDDFIEQVQWADVIFFGGGTSYKLIEIIKNMNIDFVRLFEGKTVSGSSAGANMVSEWFYGHGAKEVGQGLGVLPITVYAHYKAPYGAKFWLSDEKTIEIEKELVERSGNSEIIYLPEQEFIVRSA